jgi:2'-5' RNA ligase
MPFAIELILDSQSSAIVTSVWLTLAVEGLGTVLTGRPHVTLSDCQEIDVPLAKENVKAFAQTYAPSPVQFGSFGTFANETSVVFLAPVVTQSLVAAHADFWNSFAGCVAESRHFYHPENWIPHCTLGQGLMPEQVPRAIAISQAIDLPLFGCFEAISIVEFPALIDLGTWPLVGTHPLSGASTP